MNRSSRSDRSMVVTSERLRVETLETRELLTGQVLVPDTTERTPNQHFAAHCYEDLLSRPAEPAGLAYWSVSLDRGVPRDQIVQGIMGSPEGRERTVQVLYREILGRDVDPSGLQSMNTFLAQGGSREEAEVLLLGSQEYYQTRGGGTTSEFLDALFHDVLDREVDENGQTYFAERLAAGADRMEVAKGVLKSQEGRETRVQELYRTYLRREADLTGLAFHANALVGLGSESQVQASMVGSDECYNRQRLHPDDAVTTWNDILLQAIRTDATAPPRASRIMAIVQGAVADTLTALSGLGTLYLATSPRPLGVSREAAVFAAAHHTLTALFPAQKATFDTALQNSLAFISDGPCKEDALAFGRGVAEAYLALRANDGSANTIVYTPETGPGDWQPTPPAFAAALLPQWPGVTPFLMSRGNQFRPAGQPALSSQTYANDFNEVKSLGSKTSTTRTPDQTVIARFWADGAGTVTPPGHWNQIARDVGVARGNTLTENARLFAMLNFTLADAAIVAWDVKYQTDFWRPVTAIRAAETDGNEATVADTAWEPLLTTPPFPTYVSGHSTFSGAAATMLSAFFGSQVPFSTQADDGSSVVRGFRNFQAAAEEAGQSRIYGGIHFQFDNTDGLAAGRALGQLAAARFLPG